VSETGADEALVASIRLCVSEALANAVLHAYAEHSGLVEIVVDLEDGRIVLTVRDHGRGLGRTPDPAHAGMDGGLGLEIIRKLTQSVIVTSEIGHGTEIRMTFHPGEDSVGLTGGVYS
jgi:anti-sigma regulatory factor (Ser/Thr protein kinase)